MALTFSLFLMKLFLLPIERNNYVGSMSKYVSVVCRSCSCFHRRVGQCVGRRVSGIGFLTFTNVSKMATLNFTLVQLFMFTEVGCTFSHIFHPKPCKETRGKKSCYRSNQFLKDQWWPMVGAYFLSLWLVLCAQASTAHSER